MFLYKYLNVLVISQLLKNMFLYFISKLYIASPLDKTFRVRLSLRFQKVRFQNSDFKMCNLKKNDF